MTVSFNSIPVDIRTPGQYLEFDNTRAIQGLPAIHQRILVIGIRGTSGTAAANQLVQVRSAGEASKLFGGTSPMYEMLRALKGANSYTETWACAVSADPAGVAATGTLTIGGTPTESGTLVFYIGGVRTTARVDAGDTPTVIAARLVTSITATTPLPVSATNVAGVITLTARYKGEYGNQIDLRLNYYAGDALPVGLTATAVAMAGGTLNPSISGPIANVGDQQFETWICQFTDAANLLLLENEMARRFGPMVQREGHAFVAVGGAQGAAQTLGNAHNSPHLSIVYADKSPTTNYIWAAVVGAIDAYEPDPARPRQTLWLPGLLPPVKGFEATREERNNLLYSGLSTFVVDSGGRCLIERLITTYKTDAFGITDISYLDIETLRTIAYLRFSVRARIAQKFPRHKLASDGTQYGPGQAIVTPNVIRSELVALFIQWESAGLVEGREQFKADLIVERNANDPNRVDAVIPPDVVNQFRVFAGQLQFRL